MPSPFSQALVGLAPQMKPYKKALYEQEDFQQPPISQAMASRSPGMSQGSVGLDPSVQRYLIESALKDEAQEKLNVNSRLGDKDEIASLARVLGTHQAELAGSPITKQRAQVEANEAARQDAYNEGYGHDTLITSPMSRAAGVGSSSKWGDYGIDLNGLNEPDEPNLTHDNSVQDNRWTARGTDPIKAKKQALEEMDRYKADTGVRSAGAAAKGNLDVANANNASQLEREKQFGELQKALRTMGGNAPEVQSFAMPGKNTGGRMSFDTSPTPNVSTGVAGRMATARQQYEMAKGTDNEAAAKAQLDQIGTSIVSNYPTQDNTLKEWAWSAYNTPETQEMSAEEILNAFPDIKGADRSIILDMLRQLKGK